MHEAVEDLLDWVFQTAVAGMEVANHMRLAVGYHQDEKSKALEEDCLVVPDNLDSDANEVEEAADLSCHTVLAAVVPDQGIQPAVVDHTVDSDPTSLVADHCILLAVDCTVGSAQDTQADRFVAAGYSLSTNLNCYRDSGLA